jgi:hypothetical protein
VGRAEAVAPIVDPSRHRLQIGPAGIAPRLCCAKHHREKLVLAKARMMRKQNAKQVMRWLASANLLRAHFTTLRDWRDPMP